MASPTTSTGQQSQTVLRRGATLVADHVRLHPGPFLIAVLGAAVFAGCTVLSTVVLGRIADEIVIPVFETGETGKWSVGTGVAAVLSVSMLRVAGVVTRRYFASITSERVQSSLRHQLVDQYLGLPLAWHQRTPAGQLLAHADNDAEVATEVLHPLPFSVGVILLGVFSIISLLLVDIPLALIAFVVFPVLAGVNKVYSGLVEVPAARVQESVGRVATIAHESFDGALVVKTLGRSGAESERFGEAVQELRARRVVVGYLRAGFEAFLDAMPNIGIVLVMIVGAYRVDAGAVRPGELVQVAALFSVLAFPVRVFGYFLEHIPPSVVAKDRLRGVFDQPLPPSMVRSKPVAEGSLQVDVCNVSFAYGETGLVLDDVTFSIGAGEVVALVGSTGEGKSTLAHLITGLLPPDSGTISVGGVLIDDLTALDRTSLVGLVFQESFLFADSIGDNIDLQGTHSAAEIAKAADVANASEFINEMGEGFDSVVGERGVTLSGGQRQRVALARALLQAPRLLVLDDATSAVDAKIEQEILAALRSELRMTTLIVAQRVSTIKLADRVIYLRQGKIAAAGTHEELLRNPAYRDLVTAYETGES